MAEGENLFYSLEFPDTSIPFSIRRSRRNFDMVSLRDNDDSVAAVAGVELFLFFFFLRKKKKKKKKELPKISLLNY